MQCGATQSVSNGTPEYRLSDYPQGRIEVFKDGQWGTVCGHWFWDSNDGANIACKKVGYAGGTVYTAGSISPATDANMPIHAGCTVCHPDDLAAGILDCSASGTAGGDDGPGWASTCADDCAGRHDLDQGAICFTSEAFVEWGAASDLVQPCGLTNIAQDPNQALVFGCIQFSSVFCVFDSTNSDGSYDSALAEFAACENAAQPDGYCKVSMSSAQFLRNEDVCSQPTNGQNSNIVSAQAIYRPVCALGACVDRLLACVYRASTSRSHSPATTRAPTTSGCTLTTAWDPTLVSTARSTRRATSGKYTSSLPLLVISRAFADRLVVIPGVTSWLAMSGSLQATTPSRRWVLKTAVTTPAIILASIKRRNRLDVF